MNSTSSIFNKIIAICERNSILSIEKNNDIIVNVKYGPLGYLLKRNIFREWLQFFVNHSEVHIFPVQLQEVKSFSSKNDCNSNESFMCEILDQYKSSIPLVAHNLPFGLAFSGNHVKEGNNVKMTDPEDVSKQIFNSDKNTVPNIVWNLKHWTYQAMAFFCDPKKSMHWFYYWQRQRYVWWRKFSAVPSHFSLSDMVQTSKDDHRVSMQFQYPWGSRKLETIKVFGTSELKRICCDIPPAIKSETESAVPCMVLCELDLDLAVLTYLCDAFEEKWLQGKLRTVLRLHHKLCPYKTSVAIQVVDNDNAQKLYDVSNRLIKELKKKEVLVFPNPHIRSNRISIELQFEQFDEMGIPYTVVLTDNSLITGIAGLRNRDTTLQEQVHITELTSKILTYLLMQTTVAKVS